jgi:hypothetical protein
MIRSIFRGYIFLLLCFFCLEFGCGGVSKQPSTPPTPQNPVPSLNTIAPDSATAGSAALTINLSGSNFLSSSAIQWNGTPLTSTYVSNTSLTAQIPATDLASPGMASVTVQNPSPGGGTTSALNFTINVPPNPVPTLTELAPVSASAGGVAFTLKVTGTQFLSSSVVLWNGSLLPTTYVSSTSLTAAVTAGQIASAGTINISVQNPAPGGGVSSAVNFTVTAPPNPVPVLMSLAPASVSAGGPAFTLKVTGTQFLSSSAVLWNGSPLPTTYASSTSLTAAVTAAQIASAGTTNISVQNPAPGGGTSNTLAFTVSLPAPSANYLTVLDIQGSDLVWNSSTQKIYVAVPGGTSTNASSVSAVDPIAATIASSQQLNSAPTGLAISDDNQYLYAVTDGGTTLQRLTLPSLASDIHWTLGTDAVTGNANLAGDVKVQPHNPHTVAVSMGSYGSGAVAIFDDGVARPQIAGGGNENLGNSLQWKSDGSGIYAAYTIGNASPYFTTVSDDALYSMPVSSQGMGSVTTYDSTFRSEGVHLHLDPATGYVYGDWGEVVNGANGIPVGNYRLSRPDGTYFPGLLSVIDPTLMRFYTLLETNESGSLAFQIQSFDQNTLQLLSTIAIPNIVGTPTNFIRWGHAGLAVVTSDSQNPDGGRLYLLDGGFVNPVVAPDTTSGTPLTLVPTLTAISPLTSIVGSGTTTATIIGRDFTGQPTAYWNGASLPTTVISNTELSVQIPASDTTIAGQAAITVSNGGSSAPQSNSLSFSVNTAAPAGSQIAVYNTGGNDLVWDANTAKIYVSAPGIQGDSGDAIGIVDPVAGTVTGTGFLGSEPAKLSLSEDGQYLYMALYGENAIQQLTLPDLKANQTWNIGGVGTFDGPNYALDLQVAPGNSQTTAVALAAFDLSPSPTGVAIYDGATPRANILDAVFYPYSTLQWGGNDSALYAADQQIGQDFLVLGVGSVGATLDQHYTGIINPYSQRIHYDNGTGLVYTDGGQVIQPSNGISIGAYGSSGIAVPDSGLNRVFILGQTDAQSGTLNYTVASFDQTKFTPVDTITVQNVVGTPTALIRWGNNGLAFTTRVGQPWDFQGTGPGQLYVISGDFVKPSSSGSQSAKAAFLQPVHNTGASGVKQKYPGFHRNPSF